MRNQKNRGVEKKNSPPEARPSGEWPVNRGLGHKHKTNPAEPRGKAQGGRFDRRGTSATAEPDGPQSVYGTDVRQAAQPEVTKTDTIRESGRVEE